MRVLVTGFDPFGGQTVNPSWEAVRRLPDRIGDNEIVKRRLPVLWNASADALSEYVIQTNPDRILLVGQAGGSAQIRIERIAINLCSGKDNDGAERQDEAIAPGEAAAFFATFAYSEILSALHSNAVPAVHSFSAGTYLCNYVLYHALLKYPALPTGFIHLPYMEGQADDAPFLPLDTQVRGLSLAISANR